MKLHIFLAIATAIGLAACGKSADIGPDASQSTAPVVTASTPGATPVATGFGLQQRIDERRPAPHMGDTVP